MFVQQKNSAKRKGRNILKIDGHGKKFHIQQGDKFGFCLKSTCPFTFSLGPYISKNLYKIASKTLLLKWN
jgi:hypothetical protein